MELTPVEVHGGYLVKRDDLFEVAGANGGKARTVWSLAQGARGLVTAGARSSPQIDIVARIGRYLGIPVAVHVPTGAATAEIRSAEEHGAEVVRWFPGHNSVVIARARQDAVLRGWTEIPFGMECSEAIEQTAGQVANLPFGEFRRIVVPVGSGMSLAGVLHGLSRYDVAVPVLGVVVGADPNRRLDRYGPPSWRSYVELVRAPERYKQQVEARLGDLALDPAYEAKAVRFLRPGDLFWVVGIRPTLVA